MKPAGHIQLQPGYTHRLLQQWGRPGCIFQGRAGESVLREALSSPNGFPRKPDSPRFVGKALFDDFCTFLRGYTTKETTTEPSVEASFRFNGQGLLRLYKEVPELTELILSTLGFIGLSFFGDSFHFQKEDSQGLRLTIPSFDSLLSGLAAFSGRTGLRGVITASLSTPEEIEDMMAKEPDERPLCLTTHRKEIHEFVAHPWLIFLHDVVHYLVWSQVARDMRRRCGVVFQGLMEVQKTFSHADFFPTALDVASDGFYTSDGEDLAGSFLDELRIVMGRSKDAALAGLFMQQAEWLSRHLTGSA